MLQSVGVCVTNRALAHEQQQQKVRELFIPSRIVMNGRRIHESNKVCPTSTCDENNVGFVEVNLNSRLIRKKPDSLEMSFLVSRYHLARFFFLLPCKCPFQGNASRNVGRAQMIRLLPIILCFRNRAIAMKLIKF
jgi:hypothetical protein